MTLSDSFFAPAPTNQLLSLIAEYQADRKQIEAIATACNVDNIKKFLGFFLDGNFKDNERMPHGVVDRLFKPDGAIAALNAHYWSKAIAMTDVMDYLPQSKRNEWHEQIRMHQTPEFEENTLRSTLLLLLESRPTFLAERVDGLFRALSGAHITNRPQGFGARMIVAGVINSDGYCFASHRQCGHIDDLRAVIAKFMGRDAPPAYGSSAKIIEIGLKRRGEWVVIDGGALRIRVYLKGTAHLEVHPDMAWRLNRILANLYPMAIPAKFRNKPTKKLKYFEMVNRPLPFLVLTLLSQIRKSSDDWMFGYGCKDNKAAYQEACSVIEAIGGAVDKAGNIAIDYDPRDVIEDIILSGCIPDQKAHQFYPTPGQLGDEIIALADIGADDACLEPSAGLGALATLMPTDRTLCIEISDLRCQVLKSKGLAVEQADFIEWAQKTNRRFDRVIMNPPFSEGRAAAHIRAAANLVNPNGKLVGVLPASFKGKKILLDQWTEEWSSTKNNMFEGTGVAVVVLVATKK